MIRTVLLLSLCVASFTGCSKRLSCADKRVGSWAIQFTAEAAEDGSCPYEGTVTRDGTEEELVCSPQGGECACKGGSEFGIYEVVLENTVTGDVDRAVLEVDAAPSPICIDLHPIMRFERDGAGGAGGAGN